MNIKSEYKARNNFFDKLLKVISEHFLTIAVTTVVIIIVISISRPSAALPIYDCSTLTKEDRIALTVAIDGRLNMIKESLNEGLKSTSGFERDDMQDTIDTIMYETRKEFCVPMSK